MRADFVELTLNNNYLRTKFVHNDNYHYLCFKLKPIQSC